MPFIKQFFTGRVADAAATIRDKSQRGNPAIGILGALGINVGLEQTPYGKAIVALVRSVLGEIDWLVRTENLEGATMLVMLALNYMVARWMAGRVRGTA